MIDKSVLFEAKAFLCWDKFPALTIKLIPINEAVAFFYPPTSDAATIHLFYGAESKDFSRALCLLFHEVGHFRQWQQYTKDKREDEFWELTHLDKGDSKIVFEREAWNLGSDVLKAFIKKMKISIDNLESMYQQLTEQSLLTYNQN